METHETRHQHFGFAASTFAARRSSRHASQLALLGTPDRVHMTVGGQHHQMIGARSDVGKLLARHHLDRKPFVALHRQTHVAVRIAKRAPRQHSSIFEDARRMRVTGADAHHRTGQIDLDDLQLRTLDGRITTERAFVVAAERVHLTFTVQVEAVHSAGRYRDRIAGGRNDGRTRLLVDILAQTELANLVLTATKYCSGLSGSRRDGQL